MTDHFSQLNDVENAVVNAATSNHLVSPALTPISEHGTNGGLAIQGYDADDEKGQKKDQKDGGATSNEWTQAGSPRPNGRPDTVRYKSNSFTHGQAKLSPRQIQDLVSSPDSIPIRTIDPVEDQENERIHDGTRRSPSVPAGSPIFGPSDNESFDPETSRPISHLLPDIYSVSNTPGAFTSARPSRTQHLSSSSIMSRQRSTSSRSKTRRQLSHIKTDDRDTDDGFARHSGRSSPRLDPPYSPMPMSFPIPPLSLPTYLQLELSSDRPSALYIHRSTSSDFPYESSRIKFERLLNFLLLPPNLEQVLWFGAIACLDSWLYTFTILPLRFLNAITILMQWLCQNALREVRDLGGFVYNGIGRLWERRRGGPPTSRRPSHDSASKRSVSAADARIENVSRPHGPVQAPSTERKSRKTSGPFRHRRTPSTPSALLPNHKADILQGLLIFSSCFVLMWFDASRMYHSIRGQSAIKLYVIYNMLEVFDRLFSALGQDILECLFSKETLERKENGRSKILRPFWMFLLALLYNVVHATALFYQVVTLNVAVNSYSNALLTLLMSNQFVEIKGTVFKKFEKENLFQLTCADVVERFQLWLMLLIIALRNMVEVGGLSISLSSALNDGGSSDGLAPNSTGIPLISGFVIPKAFTLMPKWTGEVLGPFLIVLGSEALVDWCKHAYINKFNNVKPDIYGRFLDVLAKDYYSHAFTDQNLTKRLGLPVLPLSCLFIRACMQTYHMFLATHMPPPIAASTTSVSLESASTPATTAALQQIDHVIRRALGRSSFGAGSGDPTAIPFGGWSLDDGIAFATMITFFLAIYLVLLATKLLLGMALLSFARARYQGMKERERRNFNTEGRRVGGWGAVEVHEDKRRWIYEDDPDGLRELREKEDRGRRKSTAGDKLDGIHRYMMAAKRIW